MSFRSLPLCVAASVLKAHPVVSLVAASKIYVSSKGAHLFQVGGHIVEAIFTACTFNGRAGYRVSFLRCEASKLNPMLVLLVMNTQMLWPSIRQRMLTQILQTQGCSALALMVTLS